MINRSSVTRWDLFKFLLLKVPTILWAGIKVDLLDHSHCKVSIRRNWRNRNPYDGVYFANIMAAAEMASGLIVFDEMRQADDVAGIKLAAYVRYTQADFIRPVKGKATVCCRQSNEITYAVLEAATNGKDVVRTYCTVHNERGKICADIVITWHITRVK